MANKHDFFTNSVGRFVSGSMTEKRTKDNDGRAIDPDDQRFEFGVAFRKDDPEMQTLFGGFWQFLSQEYANKPHVLQMVQNWFQTLNGYSMKIADGDKPNSKGQVNENTRGHFVFYFSTNYPVTTVDAQYQEIPATNIKRGWFVRVAGNITPNGLENHQAGVYMNPSAIQLIAEGDEIRGGVDAQTAFGGTQAPAALPPGARPIGAGTPAGAAFGMPGAPAMGMPGAPAQQQTASAATMPGMPGAAPAPAQPQTASPYPAILQGMPQLPGTGR